MTGKKVLIVCDTRYGSTERTSEKMADLLREKGAEVDIFNLKTTPEKEIPAFDHYVGILVGTGIKMGQWAKEVKDFMTAKKEELNSFKGHKGFFVSSGYAADPEMYEKVKIEYT